MFSRATEEKKRTHKSLDLFLDVAFENIYYYLYQTPVTKHKFGGIGCLRLYYCVFEEADIAQLQ